MDARTEIANGRTAAAEARSFVRSLADQLPRSVIDDAVLVASELVTNSYKYAGNPEGFPILVSVDVGEDRARLEVVNHSIFDPTPETEEELRETRWGLFLVDRITADWGRISEGGIWAEFEVSPD